MKIKTIATGKNRKQLKSLVLNLNAKLEQASLCAIAKDKQIDELKVKQQQLTADNINLQDKINLRDQPIEINDKEIERLSALTVELMANNSKLREEANKPFWKKVFRC